MGEDQMISDKKSGNTEFSFFALLLGGGGVGF